MVENMSKSELEELVGRLERTIDRLAGDLGYYQECDEDESEEADEIKKEILRLYELQEATYKRLGLPPIKKAAEPEEDQDEDMSWFFE